MMNDNMPNAGAARLIKELNKIGVRICDADLERCIDRAGLALVPRALWENWSWEKSPDRMGS